MQKLLCFSAERLKYDAGQVMFNAGDVGEAAYIIIDGTVEISVPTPSGPIVINNMGKNDLLGEIAIYGEVPRTATAKAITKVETLKISKELFMKVIRANPDAAVELINRCAPALEEYYDSPQNTHGDDRGHCGDGDRQARAVGGEVQSDVHGNFLKLNRLESPCIAVRRFCLPDRFSPLGA